jgi:hypothetical protein
VTELQRFAAHSLLSTAGAVAIMGAGLLMVKNGPWGLPSCLLLTSGYLLLRVACHVHPLVREVPRG